MASPSDPPTDRAGDTAQFPVTRVSTAAATDTDDVPSTGGPAHAVTAGTPGISRAGWWAITIAAAVLLVLGFLLTFGPARYWTPVPVVFLGYFLLSGVIGLVFWKGVRELRDSNPTLHSGDGPATPGARVAAAIGAVGVASALVLLPAGLSDAPANAAPCPDGSNTCGPQPTMGPQPTQGNGGNTTAPQAPNTTVPGYTPPDTPPQQGNGSTPTVQGQVPTMPTGDSPSNGCIFNCSPTQAPQAPQTGQANPPQTGQQLNPVTTAPNTPATTPRVPTTTPRLRTPTPETTTSTTSSKARDRDEQKRNSDEDREKNSGIPYQAAELAAVAGTYRRRTTRATRALRDGQVVAEDTAMYVRGLPDEDQRLLDALPSPRTPNLDDLNDGYATKQAPEGANNSIGRVVQTEFRLSGNKPMAARFMGLFLDNNGTPQQLPQSYVETWLAEDSSADGKSPSPASEIARQRAAILQDALRQARASGEAVTLEGVTPWSDPAVQGISEDSTKTLGHFSVSLAYRVTMTLSGTYRLSWRPDLFDIYNFATDTAGYSDVGQHAVNAMADLQAYGLAKPYVITGSGVVRNETGTL